MGIITRNTLGKPGVVQEYFDQRFDTSTLAAGTGLGDPALMTNLTAIFDFNYTPKDVGNILDVTWKVWGRETANTGDAFQTLFGIVGETNARATYQTGKPHDGAVLDTCIKEMGQTKIVIASLATLNFQLRAGIGSGNWVLNQQRLNAGAASHSQDGSWIKIVERRP